MEDEDVHEQSAAELLREAPLSASSDPARRTLHTTHGGTSLVGEIRGDKEVRFKVILSMCVSFAYGILGWTKGQLGPAFLDILVISGTDIETGSAFMTSYFIGRMMGPIMAGLFYSKINKYLIFAISMTTCSLMVGLIPLCTGYEQMLTAHVLYGISGGVLVVAVISEAVAIWGRTPRGRSYIQVLNTVAAICSAVSPLATAPFLLQTSEKEIYYRNSSNVTIGQYEVSMINTTSFNNITDSSLFPEPTSRLYIAYTISAAIVLIGVTPFCALYCHSRSNNTTIKQDQHVRYKFLGGRSILVKRLQLVNVCIFTFVYFDLDFTFSGYLSAFCVLGLDWTRSSGAYLTSVVFFATMFGRISGIVLVQILQVHTILLFSTLAYTAGFTGILISAHAHVDFGIWVSICIIGFPFGLSWPTFISWVNENLLPVYGKVPALLNTIGFLGCVINPLLLGYLMKELSPLWFSYLSVGKSFLTVVNVLLMFVYKSQNNTETTDQQDRYDGLDESR